MKRLTYLLLVVALILPASLSVAQEMENTVYVGLAGEPANLDPRNYNYTQSTFAISWQIYEPLIYHDTRTDELLPGLAESWEALDADSWQFNLRQDVTWHDGEPFTADDVAWTLSHIPFQVRQYDLDREMPVEVVDDYTIIVNTNGPIGYFMRQTLALNVRIMPEHIMEPFYTETRAMVFEPTTDEDGNEVTAEQQLDDALYAINRGDDWTEPPYIGTGPFMFNNWERGVEIVLDANPNYWGGAPNVDHVVYRWVEEATSRLIGLEAGDFDLIIGVPELEVERLADEENIEVLASPGLGYHMITINTRTEALADARVRQAIAYAIDQDEILSLYPGTVTRTCGPLSVNSGFYNDAVPCYDYDPDMAMSLLAEAEADGAWNPDTVITIKTIAALSDEALLVQQYLGDVGIQVEVIEVEPGSYYSEVRTGEAELALYTFGNIVDPDHIYWVFHNDWLGGGIFGYNNDRLNTLLVDGKGVTEFEPRQAIYNEAQDIIVGEALAVFLYSGADLAAYRTDRLEGMQAMPRPTDVFYWLSEVSIVE